MLCLLEKLYLNLQELLQVATPAVLPLPGPHGHYKRGYGLVLFLNSRGEVTAYHPYGERAWQVQALAAQPYISIRNFCSNCDRYQLTPLIIRSS